MAWRPLVAGDQAARVDQAIAAIAGHLARVEPAAPGLAAGAAGLAVFHHHLAAAGRGGGERVELLLEQAIEAVAAQAMQPGLHEGFAGVAWAVQHIVAARGDDADELLGDIDLALLELTARGPWHDRYDLISGLVGFGVYALERRPRPIAQALLDNIVARLDELARPAAAGRAIPTPRAAIHADLRGIATADHHTTGLAHGIAGAIALLGDAPGDRAAALRRELASWLIATSDPQPDGAQHPPFVDAGRSLGRRGAAWCSGDPGIAIALMRAARTDDASVLAAHAISLSHAAARRPVVQCGVHDAGLCHGAAGLMHIFNCLYQATGQSVFRDASLRWLDETLAFSHFSDHGLLTGAAGIGLALLAVVEDRAPRWDRVLLCDLGHP